VDESKVAEFRSKRARLRSENELKKRLTEVRAINRAVRDLVVDSPTQQAFLDTFGREIGPADYLKLGLLDEGAAVEADLSSTDMVGAWEPSGIGPTSMDGLAVKGTDPVAAERKALLEAYKSEGLRHGVRITDKMIAEAACRSWHERTPVQRWKRNDSRSTTADDAKIRAVLKKKSHWR
jgi:hypothetical protein